MGDVWVGYCFYVSTYLPTLTVAGAEEDKLCTNMILEKRVLHAITAAFHEVRRHFRDHRYVKGSEAGPVNDYGTPVAHSHGNGAVYRNGTTGANGY